MNQLKRVIALSVLITLFISCEKEAPLSKAKEMLSFKIEASRNNEVLLKDVEGVIEGNKVTLSIPEEIDITNLIPTFFHNGVAISVGPTLQESAITPNDFSNNLTYLITAQDGSQISYSVVVQTIQDPGLLFKAFSFKQEHNPALALDYDLKAEGNNFTDSIKSLEKELIPVFETDAIAVSVNGIGQESGKTKVDFTHPVVYTLTSDYGTQKEYTIAVSWQTGLPHLFIVTEGNTPVDSKDSYFRATIKLEGGEFYEDYEGTLGIRGRGNSTWSYPKKPYRLKLDKKESLLGLSSERDWILLANYLDGTLMLNAVASKTALLLDMPFTNTMIPVDVTLNGEYMGNYMFTEHKEVEKNRIDVTDGGTLLELDTYYDEPWKFRSTHFDLPVMIAYPELDDYAIGEAISEQERIITEFQMLEDTVFDDAFPDNNYLDYIDADSLINYLIVYNLTQNREINHPKSTYLHKQKEGKYMMGPIWDFDWAFDFNGTNTYFQSATGPLFLANGIGSRFFRRFLTDPVIQEGYGQKWASFKMDKLPELLAYIDEYADTIKYSKEEDYQKWQRGSGSFMEDVQKLRIWVQDRALYMDSYITDFN